MIPRRDPKTRASFTAVDPAFLLPVILGPPSHKYLILEALLFLTNIPISRKQLQPQCPSNGFLGLQLIFPSDRAILLNHATRGPSS